MGCCRALSETFKPEARSSALNPKPISTNLKPKTLGPVIGPAVPAGVRPQVTRSVRHTVLLTVFESSSHSCLFVLHTPEGPYTLPLWNQLRKTIIRMVCWDLIPYSTIYGPSG